MNMGFGSFAKFQNWGQLQPAYFARNWPLKWKQQLTFATPYVRLQNKWGLIIPWIQFRGLWQNSEQEQNGVLWCIHLSKETFNSNWLSAVEPIANCQPEIKTKGFQSNKKSATSKQEPV